MKNKRWIEIKIQFYELMFSLRQINYLFYLVFIISLLCVFNYECKIITLTNSNPFLKGLNKLSVEILYAYITGFFLFVIIEVVSRGRRKLEHWMAIHNNTAMLIDHIYWLIEGILRKKYHKQTVTIDFDEFISICKATNRHDITSGGRHINVTIEKMVQKTRDALNHYTLSLRLDAEQIDDEEIGIISKIHYHIFSFTEFLGDPKQGNLNRIAGDIWFIHFNAKLLYSKWKRRDKYLNLYIKYRPMKIKYGSIKIELTKGAIPF